MPKGLPAHPQQSNLRSLWHHSESRMHSLCRSERERLNGGLRSWSYCEQPAKMTMPKSDLLYPLQQPAMKSFVTPSPSRANSLSPVLSATEWSWSQVRKQTVPPVVNPVTWPTPICQDERERVFVIAVENGAAALQPNHHQRALWQAETIQHLVKYPRVQCDKECQLYTRRRKKMELPPDQPTEIIRSNHPTVGWGSMLSLHNPDPTVSRRLVCWKCKAKYHIYCTMSNRTHIVRTKATPWWQCTSCSQKPVADRQDNQMAQVLDKKSPVVHPYQLRILQCNANGIHRELPLLEYLLEATNVDVVCIQETNLPPKDNTPELRSFSAIWRDRPLKGEARSTLLWSTSKDRFPTKSATNRPITQARWWNWRLRFEKTVE